MLPPSFEDIEQALTPDEKAAIEAWARLAQQGRHDCDVSKQATRATRGIWEQFGGDRVNAYLDSLSRTPS